MIIENFLKNLGLTDMEIRVYLYLFTHGESIASVVAKRLDLKRASVYATLESLEQKDMINSFLKNNVTHYDAIESDELVNLCEQRVNEMQRLKTHANTLKDEFKKLRDKGKIPVMEVRGKIKYYEGLDAVVDLINETLEEKEKEQLCFGLNTFHTNLAGTDWGDYTKRRITKGMFVKSIQPDTDAALEYQARDKNELRKTFLVPKDKFPGKCEINIIGDMIAMFSASKNGPAGMKLYNKDFAEALRSLFNLAYERAEIYDDEVDEDEEK